MPLRAMRLADQVLQSLNAHHWDGDASVTPLPAQPVETHLRAPRPPRLADQEPSPEPFDRGALMTTNARESPPQDPNVLT